MSVNIHATCVSLNSKGVLILGDSGSGKSDLALRLITLFSAKLVSDDRIEVSDIEISRTGKNYTVFTLRELKKHGDTMYFLCGADKLHSFNKWYCFEEILEMCTLVFVRRETECNILSKADELKRKYGAKIEILDMDVFEMSSTDVREKLRSGEDVSEMLPQAVYKYLICNNLYME